MKKYISTTLIICLLLSVLSIDAAEHAAISATATVIPVLGVMPTINQSQSLSVSESSDSKLLIQSPKNSALLIHIANVNKPAKDISSLLKTPANISTHKNSVSEILEIDLSKFKSNKESQQIVTIFTIDN